MAKNLQLQAVITATDEASKVFKKVQGSVEKMGKSFETFQKDAGEFGKIMSVVGGAGVLAIKSFVDSANEAERAQAQLNAVLKSTQGIAGVTSQAALDLSVSLMKTSTASDEAILGGESMLLTFTNIGKDVFPQATQTLLDMAVAMNQGATPSAEQLSSQAIQLGKALNDPTQGLSALSRVGVKFTEDQEKQIKTLQKSGDIMGAQKIILGELAREFGGSAQAAAQTFSGQVEQMQNRLGELGEELGKALLPILTFFVQKLGELITWFESLTPQQKEFIAQTVAIGTALAAAAGFVGLLIAALNPVTVVAGAVVIAFAYLSAKVNEAGLTWEEFGVAASTTWAEFQYWTEYYVDLVIFQLRRLTLASQEELDQLVKDMDEHLAKTYENVQGGYDRLNQLHEKKLDEQKKVIEDQIAAQRDIVDKSTGQMKEDAKAKLTQLKEDGLKQFKDLKLGSTAELAAMRKAEEIELQKTNEVAAKKFAEQVGMAVSWGAHLIQNLTGGILGKIPILQGAIENAKAIMNQIHQSYNPELPAQLWGEHFLENFAAGMKDSAPKVFAETNEMKAALAAEFGNDGEIQKLMKEWTKDKSVEEHFAQIAEQVREQTGKLNSEFEKQKEDYNDLNLKAGESLEKLKQKHEEELSQINQKIAETEQKITDLNNNYKVDIQGVDTSVGEKVVKQQDLLAELQKQIDEAQSGGDPTADLQARFDKESAALQNFLATSTGLEDEIAEARRRANETDFERFIEDSNSRRDQLTEEFQKRLDLLEEEKKSLEDQRQKEKEIFDQKLLQYEALKVGFTSMQTVFITGLSTMATTAQQKVDFINKKLAEMKAAFEAMSAMSGGSTPLVAAPAPATKGFATGGIASGSESGFPVTLHGTEAVVPLPDGRSIPVEMQGGNTEKQIVVNLNFGDVNIAKEVDADRFISRMKTELTREIQLQQMGSI